MQVYLPIAELSVNIFMVVGLGGITGILSGLFGVGGGFLITPFLMFIGVPPAVAVASSANQIVATSYSGFLAYLRKQSVDFKMGRHILIGGFTGAFAGVLIFKWLRTMGYVDLLISLSYVFFLGSIGLLMAAESLKSLRKGSAPSAVSTPAWTARLPLKADYPTSKVEASIFVPIGIGIFVGMMVSIMGVGGGFLMIPAMIYLIGMPTGIVIGTSLFIIIFITAQVTFMQSVLTQTVDIMLALLLLIGSVIGAQFGSKLGHTIPAVKLRALLALLVLGVAGKLAYSLFATPENLYTIVGL